MLARLSPKEQVEAFSIPTCQPGIGALVTSPTDRALIAGIGIEPLTLWPDDRGYFLEAARLGQGAIRHFPPETTQISATSSYPGTIKAFHYHLDQTDCWIPLAGMFQVALVDCRQSSRTLGIKNTLYIGMLRPWQILIPPGIAHGYKVIGDRAATMIYVTNRFYNPADEGRIAHNDPRVGYDWNTQHR